MVGSPRPFRGPRSSDVSQKCCESWLRTVSGPNDYPAARPRSKRLARERMKLQLADSRRCRRVNPTGECGCNGLPARIAQRQQMLHGLHQGVVAGREVRSPMLNSNGILTLMTRGVDCAWAVAAS